METVTEVETEADAVLAEASLASNSKDWTQYELTKRDGIGKEATVLDKHIIEVPADLQSMIRNWGVSDVYYHAFENAKVRARQQGFQTDKNGVRIGTATKAQYYMCHGHAVGERINKKGGLVQALSAANLLIAKAKLSLRESGMSDDAIDALFAPKAK